MADYKLAAAAVADLADIYTYTTETYGFEKADSYTDAFKDSFEILRNFPDAGRKISSVRKTYRALRVGNHVVFYVKQADDTVFTVRVLHASMQPGGRLE